VFEGIQALVVDYFKKVCFGRKRWLQGRAGFPEFGEGGIHDIFSEVYIEIIFDFAVYAKLGIEFFKEGFKVGFLA
jgi:hypothetical protein